MRLPSAPCLTLPGQATPPGQKFWIKATDGVRCRIGLWLAKNSQGSVLLFPGRTEYVEVYQIIAGDFVAGNYNVLTIDWRGQGLADRVYSDRRLGHVAHLSEYQKDVAAMISAARALNLTHPWHLLGHSMGGCIGLRAINEGLPVASVVFSSPMWGINLPLWQRAIARHLSGAARLVNLGKRYAPYTQPIPYLLRVKFENNALTNNRDMFEFLRAQLQHHPDLGLGGPSMTWLYAALTETKQLAKTPSPALPCITYLGEHETVVDSHAIKKRMSEWSRGRLIQPLGTRHEPLMESAQQRGERIDEMVTMFCDATPDVP